MPNQSSYPERIGSLSFMAVPLELKEGFSDPTFCHRNCENYILAHPGTQHVIGWAKLRWDNGFRYTLHSCIREAGVIKDITPRSPISPTDLFGEDPNVQIDPSCNFEFRFQEIVSGQMINLTHYVSESSSG